MKAVFISFDQAHTERILDILDRLNCRGFTSWQQVNGRGSRDGEPHYASAILTMVADDRVEPLLARLRAINDESPRLGLRAFVWKLEEEGV